MRTIVIFFKAQMDFKTPTLPTYNLETKPPPNTVSYYKVSLPNLVILCIPNGGRFQHIMSY